MRRLQGLLRRGRSAAADASGGKDSLGRGWEASRFDLTAPRRSSWPWWASGIAIGCCVALVVFAPASWLAAAIAGATGERVLLADARGSVWSGNAVLVLTGGPASRDASALPGRLRWTLGLARENRARLELRLRHACCIGDQLRLRVEFGLGGWRVALPAGRTAVGHWPAAWLAGLGTPFNTLQLGGLAHVASEGLAVESQRGRLRISGRAEVELQAVSSRLSTLDTLGSYRITLAGGKAEDGAALELTTLAGPLRLSGSGQWVAAGLRFRGEARADPGAEPMLNNLLNLIGRRQGAAALLAIG